MKRLYFCLATFSFSSDYDKYFDRVLFERASKRISEAFWVGGKTGISGKEIAADK